MLFSQRTSWRILTGIITVLLLVFGVRPLLFPVSADQLPNRSVKLSDNSAGATANYLFQFDETTGNTVGSIRFQFCSDTPLLDSPCTAPAGFDATGASLANQTGETGYSIAGGDANDIILTRTAVATTASTSSYEFSGVLNPSGNGTYYIRVQTYASEDASGTMTDGGGLAFAIASAVTISTEVPPYLLYCTGLVITNYDCSTAAGAYINFGELSASATKSAQSQMVIATNAGNGYAVTISGDTMLSGNSSIPGLGSGDVSRPGTSQFGLNLVANTTPTVGEDVSGPGLAIVAPGYNTADRFRFAPGATIVESTGTSDLRKFTISYIVNVAQNQPPGIYISTLTYICLANF